MEKNPLLTTQLFPQFSEILPQHIEPAIKQIIAEDRAKLTTLLSQPSFTWDNLMVPLEEMHDRLSKAWSPVSHLHAVMQNDALRQAYNTCQPLLTEYHTELMQNESLYQAIQSIASSPAYQTLNPAQKKVIDNDLRDFQLAGVHLPPSAKARFGELQKQLAKLTTHFAENVLDATQAWTLHVTHEDALQGLPEQTIKMLAQNAEQRGKKGWVFTLDYPCYSSAIKYLANRELRWLMYEAYVTRASDQGPHAGQWDNTPIIEEILKIRHELANLLEFPNYAVYSLAKKMAEKPETVLTFLNDLVDKSKSMGIAEMQELSAYAKSRDGIDQLAAWDLAYYAEKLREEKYALTQEELRPYFPIHKVLSGMFAVFHQLFGLKIVEKKNVDVWHPHVQCFSVFDANDELRGYFYTDLYARPNKRDGAWMDECRVRRRLPNGQIQEPIAYLTCNFTRPLGDQPALLTHDDVLTLFHEFGHCMHHLLTKVEYASVSGINGVPWDAVEFPSQFFEYWCFEKATLALISQQVDTGEMLPDALYNKMIAAKNFHAALQMLRQLEFSLFDFRVHLEYDPTKDAQAQQKLNEVRQAVAVVPYSSFNRFQHSFSHIFSGSYAAGYYSYKWAEVLSSDAYSKFEEQGIFNREVGQSYLENILEKGGVYKPMDLFIAFRGREPKIDALLRHSGLVEASHLD